MAPATAWKHAKTVPPIAENAGMTSTAEMAYAAPPAKTASNAPMIAEAVRSTAGMVTATRKKRVAPAAGIVRQRARNKMNAKGTVSAIPENASVSAMKPANASPTALAVVLLCRGNVRMFAKITASAATTSSRWENFAMMEIAAPEMAVLQSASLNPVATMPATTARRAVPVLMTALRIATMRTAATASLI